MKMKADIRVMLLQVKDGQQSTRSYDGNIEQILIHNSQKEPTLLTKLVDVIDLQHLELQGICFVFKTCSCVTLL